MSSQSQRRAPQSAKTLFVQRRCSVDASVTYAAQDKLPRLPIPELSVSLEKFKARLEALQNEAQQKETALVVDQFLLGDGPKLQTALKEYEAAGFSSGQVGSYVEEFWNEAYLSPDDSVVLNVNPFFVLESGPDPKFAKDQNHRAASLCFASLKMASALKHHTLTPDVFRGKPLCMDQFKALFGSSRQPSDGHSDDVHVYRDSSHVVVLCRNQFYYFTALWPKTGHVAVTEAEILAILRAIQAHADELDLRERCRSGVGVLTSLPRSKWAVRLTFD